MPYVNIDLDDDEILDALEGIYTMSANDLKRIAYVIGKHLKKLKDSDRYEAIIAFKEAIAKYPSVDLQTIKCSSIIDEQKLELITRKFSEYSIDEWERRLA